ncbi:hypothetical protein HN014_22130 (plasmid) [Aquimarina sp. TRL1]|uniref:hypothetical protein n=1 Tax=Aquimarina sp. (strain TRL1) TaxID=2736252 RepID=UPI001589A366|nr:hypothetical protein [Aquimarina sp. TRL1]QKX07700.1 hypothetical protein HN014_22130 [Aquimarina sp. TRL1]
MAHDVTFSQKDKNVFFFGYAEGIFYQMFNCQKFDAGLSGAGKSVEVDYQTCLDTVITICNSVIARNYPDKDRFPRLEKEILDKFSKNKGNIKIRFS